MKYIGSYNLPSDLGLSIFYSGNTENANTGISAHWSLLLAAQNMFFSCCVYGSDWSYFNEPSPLLLNNVRR